MSKENVERIRAGIAIFNRGEVDAENRYLARGPGSGMDIAQIVVTAYSFRNGLVYRVHDHVTREEALEAAGLQE